MEIAVAGLGRMGAGMARRLARGGHPVVAWNRHADVARELAAEPENQGRVTVADPLEQVREAMSGARHVIISVPSGDATEQMIRQLTEILEPADVIVDAGNSNFHDSQRRAAMVEEHGLGWLDMGVSGGIWGLRVGFCAMLGGRREVFERFEPAVQTLAPESGYLYCGPAGSGHYVKMVHNGIEYGVMQAIGEGFDILHASDYELDLAAIAELWNHGSVIRSWLMELAASAFQREGSDLEAIKGWVADSGEGRWTVLDAIDHNVPAPVITLSLMQRFRSRREPDSFTDRVLAALRNEFGGHAIVGAAAATQGASETQAAPAAAAAGSGPTPSRSRQEP
jgi:6-phosphogluconate dehydrogenase